MSYDLLFGRSVRVLLVESVSVDIQEVDIQEVLFTIEGENTGESLDLDRGPKALMKKQNQVRSSLGGPSIMIRPTESHSLGVSLTHLHILVIHNLYCSYVVHIYIVLMKISLLANMKPWQI